jgi:hypothetical protein
MAFPKRFKNLLEPDPHSVPRPDYVWLVWAACGSDESACGWSGWTIEVALRRSATRQPTSTLDENVPADDRLQCPNCGRALFRTDISLRLEPSADQRHAQGEAGVDYEVSPIEYE